jgi:hypothetical protein
VTVGRADRMPAAHLGFCGSRRGQQGVLHARRPRRPGSRPRTPALRNAVLCRAGDVRRDGGERLGRRPGVEGARVPGGFPHLLPGPHGLDRGRYVVTPVTVPVNKAIGAWGSTTVGC